jgi:hypothetical protein
MRGADWLAFIPGRLIYVMLHERNNKGKFLVIDLINAFISSKVHRKTVQREVGCPFCRVERWKHSRKYACAPLFKPDLVIDDAHSLKLCLQCVLLHYLRRCSNRLYGLSLSSLSISHFSISIVTRLSLGFYSWKRLILTVNELGDITD